MSKKRSMPLEDRLRNQISSSGPISIANFIAQALYDPKQGYYATKIPIGRTGDYITAPEMTQAFGEVIGLWLIDLWYQGKRPTPFHLIELGPGRGTLMADILRTFRSLKLPLPKMTVHLVEISPLLKQIQQEALSFFPCQIFWHKNLSTLPNDQGFCLMVANEFWDALPIQQYVQGDKEWIERHVGLKEDEFTFLPDIPHPIKEVCPAMPPLVLQISSHLKQQGGVALFLDYGYTQPEAWGDTLQALYHHHPQSPLTNIGQADLTHHVDFHCLKRLFTDEGLDAYGPTPQGDFLKAIGFNERTEQLCVQANDTQKSLLQTAAVRLTHPSQMGTLFKAMAVISGQTLQRPHGF